MIRHWGQRCVSLCVRRVAVVAVVSGLAGCASMVTVVDGTYRGIGDRPLLSVPAPSAETARPLASANGSEVSRNAGWRMGVVHVTEGPVAVTLREKLSIDEDVDPQLFVWGYQFEYHYGVLGGINGLVTILPMLVGLERSAAIPAVNTVIGLRFAGGFEFGAGVHYSPRIKPDKPDWDLIEGLGAVFSLGYARRPSAEGRVSIPFNFALVKSEDSTTYAITVGWTIPKE